MPQYTVDATEENGIVHVHEKNKNNAFGNVELPHASVLLL